MAIATDIALLADKYATNLRTRVDERVAEMGQDDNSHYLIYRVLGIATEEGRLIDVYQNKGRFLYKSRLQNSDRFGAAQEHPS